MEHRIIHVCGTMGSGKTTLIRGWMAERKWVAVNRGGARYPIGYTSDEPERQMFLAGGYDDALQTSGLDVAKGSVEENYALLTEKFRQGLTVVYEGLLMMNHTRGLQLLRDTRALTILRLTTSLDECRAGVVARRAAQGNHDPLPPRFEDGLRGNNTRAINYAFKLKQAGATVHKVSREEAATLLRELT